MKHLILTLLMTIILFSNIAAQWEILNEGLKGYFRDIQFVNENMGWIACGQLLLKTEDGGETWFSIPVQDDYYLERINFVNDSVGWSYDNYDSDNENSKILKSDDGGLSWRVQFETSYSFDELYAVNDSVVYFIGKTWGTDYWNGKIYKTENGGLNWVDRSPNLTNKRLESVCFSSADAGVITGNYDDGNTRKGLIVTTFDGGKSWKSLTLSKFENIYDAKLINDTTAYFLAINEDAEYFLCITTDMFNAWKIKAQSKYGIDSYFILNDSYIFAVIKDSLSTKVMKSIDGGITWKSEQDVIGGELYFSSNDIGFILFAGYVQALYKSTDGGESWKLHNLSCPFLDVFFIDQNNGFACCGYSVYFGHGGYSAGYFFRSNDGGVTWRHDITTNSFMRSCIFLDDQIGFRLSKQRIQKTDDFGENWYNVFTNNPDSNSFSFTGNDFAFSDNQNGWTAGVGSWSDSLYGAAILGTTDGGETWDLIWKYPHTDLYDYDLQSIHVVNTTAWAVGESGLIVKSISPDSFRVISANTDLPLRDVFFSDENHGWIAGGYFDSDNEYLILLKTTDGGETWEEIPDFDYQINDMYFADSLHGWAVGNDTSYSGMILESLDGGNNWNAQVADLSAPLNAIHFKDGFGWAVGGNGLVLRTEDGATWIDEKNNKAFPSNYSLSQNYPNPFNPTTVISYHLPVSSHVELTIYNLLGQKVTSLVKEKQPAGSHQVEWDATGLSSGVYYYRLEASDFTKTKKLILLK